METKEALKTIKNALENNEFSREKVLIYLFEDKDGDLMLNELNFSDYEGDIYIGSMKVKNNLYQNSQDVEGDLHQDFQVVEGILWQNGQNVGGNLWQNNQDVEGKIYE